MDLVHGWEYDESMGPIAILALVLSAETGAALSAEDAQPSERRPILAQLDEIVEQVIRESKPPAKTEHEEATTSSSFEDGTLHVVVPVRDWNDDPRLVQPLPPRTLPFFGVPSGGSAGSPSFDPVARKYFWE